MDEKEKDIQRRELEQDMKAYLERGGSIQEIPNGAGEQVFYTITEKSRRREHRTIYQGGEDADNHD